MDSEKGQHLCRGPSRGGPLNLTPQEQPLEGLREGHVASLACDQRHLPLNRDPHAKPHSLWHSASPKFRSAKGQRSHSVGPGLPQWAVLPRGLSRSGSLACAEGSRHGPPSSCSPGVLVRLGCWAGRSHVHSFHPHHGPRKEGLFLFSRQGTRGSRLWDLP